MSSLLLRALKSVERVKLDPKALQLVYMRKQGREGRLDQMKTTFDKMLQNFTPTQDMFHVAMKSYAHYGKSEAVTELFDQMKQYNLEPDMEAYKAIVRALCENGSIQEAEKFFKTIPEQYLHVHMYNELLRAYFRSQMFNKGLVFFADMKNPDIVTYGIMIDGYTRAGNMEEAYKLLDEMCKEHNFEVTPVITNMILNGYCIQGNKDNAARKFFDSITADKVNQYTYNTMINHYFLVGDFVQGKQLFTQMVNSKITPDVVTFNSMITGYVAAAMMKEATILFNSMSLYSITPDLKTLNTMLEGFCKTNAIEQAAKLFEIMTDRSVLTYTIMIKGYFYSGKFDDGMKILDDMDKDQVKPNTALFDAMLTGFLRRRKFDQAERLFTLMTERYQITPSETQQHMLLQALINSNEHERVETLATKLQQMYGTDSAEILKENV
jgi:pentatricopeptide repeat protein